MVVGVFLFFPFVSFLRIINEGLAEKVTFEKMLVDEKVSLGEHLRISRSGKANKCKGSEVRLFLLSRISRQAIPSGGSDRWKGRVGHRGKSDMQ